MIVHFSSESPETPLNSQTIYVTLRELNPFGNSANSLNKLMFSEH